MAESEHFFSHQYVRTPEEIQVQIKLIKLRFKNLKLTKEQAEKIYTFEQEKDTYIEGHYFTLWEESDYESSVFSSILKPAQIKLYEQERRKGVKQQEKYLVQGDKEQYKINELAFAELKLQFYQTQIVPAFFKDPHSLYFSWLQEDKAKQEYLKGEYQRYLRRSKLEKLTSHFRNYRTLAPNALKVTLLQHRLNYIWPDTATFLHVIDEPTKAVLRYMASRMNYLPDKLEKLITQVYQEIETFHEANFEKYFGDRRGWHTIICNPSKEEAKEQQVLLLLLLTKEGYQQ